MSKEEFLLILELQQQSGLSIKDFCDNESYPASCFHYWKSKYGVSRPYVPVSRSSSSGFAPVSLRSGSIASSKGLPIEACNDESIIIELPNGVKIHFRGTCESGTALQVITQLCQSHVLPE